MVRRTRFAYGRVTCHVCRKGRLEVTDSRNQQGLPVRRRRKCTNAKCKAVVVTMEVECGAKGVLLNTEEEKVARTLILRIRLAERRLRALFSSRAVQE